MADVSDPVDDVISATDRFSPAGGVPMTRPKAVVDATDAQNAADVIEATQRASGVTAPPPAPPPQPGWLSRSFHSILDLPRTIAANVTAPHLPGTDAPVPVLGDNAPIAEPHFLQGAARGARDVIDTGAHGLAWAANQIPGVNVDVDAMRVRDKAERDAWEQQYGDSPMASIGRVAGQTVATAGPVGAVGRVMTRGASLLPTAVGDAARFLTGATPAASAPGRAVQLVSQGAGVGGTQAAMTSSGYDQPLPDQIGTGIATGAALGPVIGGATRVWDATRGYISGVRPEVADLANTARGYGVTPPVTALTTNPNLRMVADALQKLPLSGADTGALAKQRQFQGAVTRTMGSTADTLGQATMMETANRLNQGYRDLYADAPPIAGGPRLVSDVADVGADAARFLVGDQEGAMAHVGNAMQQINAAFAHGGTLDPSAWKSLMGRNDGTLARIEDAAPSAAQPYLQRLRQAVQDRFAASAGPEAAARLRDLDSQWRAMKTVQPLAAASTTGDIGPGGLLPKVINVSNQFDGSTNGVAYTGGGPLGDLGRVGKQFFGHIPDSGTAARLQAYDFAKNPVSTAMMMIPGITVGRPMQQWLNNPTVAGRVIDTSLGGPRPDISRALPLGLLGAVDYGRDRAP